MEKKKKQIEFACVNPAGDLTKPIVRWNEKRDDLVDTGEKIDLVEEYKARAKGTTVYELIAACGGYENLATVIPQNEGVTVDLTGIPEFSNELKELADKVVADAVAKKQKEIDDEQKTKEQEYEQRIAELEQKLAAAGGY